MSTRSVFTLGVISAALLGSGLYAQDSRTWMTTRPSYDASRRGPMEIVPVWAPAQPENIPPADGGIVTLQQLKHEVPGKATKEWERSEKAREKGDYAGAIAHLRKAIAIDPEFVGARNNLGAILLFSGKYQEAIPELEECIKLDPDNSLPYSNLTIAYLMKKDFEGAERAARRTNDIDRTSTRAKLVLGLTLVMEEKLTDEALNLLLRAAEDFPQARLLSARIYAARGKADEAETAIHEYLASGDTTGTDMANEWLSIIRKARETVSASAAPVRQ